MEHKIIKFVKQEDIVGGVIKQIKISDDMLYIETDKGMVFGEMDSYYDSVAMSFPDEVVVSDYYHPDLPNVELDLAYDLGWLSSLEFKNYEKFDHEEYSKIQQKSKMDRIERLENELKKLKGEV